MIPSGCRYEPTFVTREDRTFQRLLDLVTVEKDWKALWCGRQLSKAVIRELEHRHQRVVWNYRQELEQQADADILQQISTLSPQRREIALGVLCGRFEAKLKRKRVATLEKMKSESLEPWQQSVIEEVIEENLRRQEERQEAERVRRELEARFPQYVGDGVILAEHYGGPSYRRRPANWNSAWQWKQRGRVIKSGESPVATASGFGGSTTVIELFDISQTMDA